MTAERYHQYQVRLDAAAAARSRKAIDAILSDLHNEDSSDPDVSSVADSAAVIRAMMDTSGENWGPN